MTIWIALLNHADVCISYSENAAGTFVVDWDKLDVCGSIPHVAEASSLYATDYAYVTGNPPNYVVSNFNRTYTSEKMPRSLPLTNPESYHRMIWFNKSRYIFSDNISSDKVSIMEWARPNKIRTFQHSPSEQIEYFAASDDYLVTASKRSIIMRDFS